MKIYNAEILNQVITIVNKSEELDEKLFSMISSYPECIKKSDSYILTINKHSFFIKLDKKLYNFRITLSKRDVYQIFYLFISLVANELGSCLIHSSFVSSNNNGILIVGNYGSGKTTLSNLFSKNGFEINSADRSIISCKNNNLTFLQGSKKIEYENKTLYLEKKLTTKEIKIKMVVFLEGVDKGGKLIINELDDSIRIKKRIFTAQTNVYFSPLTNTNKTLFELVPENLFLISNNISFCNNKFYTVRGDPKKIIKFIKQKMEVLNG